MQDQKQKNSSSFWTNTVGVIGAFFLFFFASVLCALLLTTQNILDPANRELALIMVIVWTFVLFAKSKLILVTPLTLLISVFLLFKRKFIVIALLLLTSTVLILAERKYPLFEIDNQIFSQTQFETSFNPLLQSDIREFFKTPKKVIGAYNKNGTVSILLELEGNTEVYLPYRSATNPSICNTCESSRDRTNAVLTFLKEEVVGEYVLVELPKKRLRCNSRTDPETQMQIRTCGTSKIVANNLELSDSGLFHQILNNSQIYKIQEPDPKL